MSPPIRFAGPILAAGDLRRGATGGGALVEVPPDQVAALGGAKQMRVRGTMNGLAFASSTMPMGGGRLCIGLHKATREEAGVSIGDVVEIEVGRDDAPRTVELPSELGDALAAEPALRAAFDALSFTRRKEMATSIADAKRPETRAARLEKALAVLRG